MTKNNLKIVKTSKNQEIEDKEKNKALEAAISQIDENFGKGSVMKLGQKAAVNIESISTGSLSLDLALGIGGLPKGRVIEIYFFKFNCLAVSLPNAAKRLNWDIRKFLSELAKFILEFSKIVRD